MDKPRGAGQIHKVEQSELGGLISSLSRLYGAISRRLWDWRTHAYHKGGYPDVDIDIERPLDNRIDSLADRSRQRPDANQLTPSADPADSPDVTPQHDTYREVILGDALNDFTEHLHEADMDSGLGDRLRQSTWEHIHRALRLARDGDEQAARMHAGFANNALKEAAHYLSEAEYRSLVAEVSNYLAQHPLG